MIGITEEDAHTKPFEALGDLLTRLGDAGLDVRFVVGAFGARLPSDIAYLLSGALRGAPGDRRGLLAWLALLVAGEPIARTALERALPFGAELLGALHACGLVEGDATVHARVCLQPLGARQQHGRPWLLTDRLGASGDAVSAPDLSAWNVIGALPRTLFGSSALEIGAGAGAVTLHLLQAGAEVTATDLHPPSLAVLRTNLRLQRSAAECHIADVFDGVPARPYDLVVFNAPLLRAATLGDDTSTWYTASAQGEAIALRFVDQLDKYLDQDGEALLHAQWTEALAARLRPWCVTSLLFARAADGTPFGLHRIVRGEPQQRVLHTPLSNALPCMARALFERTTPAPDAALVPAPWLELVTRRALAPGAPTARTFGGVPIDEGTEACLLDFADHPRPAESALDRSLVERGWLIAAASDPR